MDKKETHLPWEKLALYAEGNGRPDGEERRHLSRCRKCHAAYAEAVRYRAASLAEPEVFALPAEIAEAGVAVAHGGHSAGGRHRRTVRRRLLPRAALAGAALAALFLVLFPFLPGDESALDPALLHPIRLALAETSASGMILSGVERHGGAPRVAYRSGHPPEDDEALVHSLRTLNGLYAGNPEDADVATWLVAAYLATGQLENARDFVNESRKRFPSHAMLIGLEVSIAYRESDLDRAESLLRDALGSDGTDPALLFNLGLLLGERGEMEESRHLLERAADSGGTLAGARAQALLDSLHR